MTGAQYHFKADVANTGAATINYCAEGAATIKKLRDQDLATGDIEAGQVVTLQYDGTNMQMQSQLASTSAGVADPGGNGIMVRTSLNVSVNRSVVAPAAGITITNGDGVSANPTLVLANDLAALEGLGSTGIAARTGADAWAQRTVTGTANEVTLANGDGVSGNPTASLAATFDISGKTSTKPVKTGTAAPGTCGVGELFFDTDATAGENVFCCTATNTWTLCGDGGGATGYQTIQEEGSGLTQRNTLDFVGSAVTCVDSGGTKTQCTFTGGGGGLTHRVSLLNSSVQPDSTGNAFSELYTVKATNDFWKHAVWTFNDTATKDCIYGSTLIPNDYSGSAVAYVFWTSTTTSGNAIWDWEYRGIGGDDAESLDQATAAESLTVTDAAPTATDRRMTSSMAITSANLAASDTLQWRLCRDGASV